MNQTKFIKDLIANVRGEIMMKSKNFPKEWNGLELRQYVSDCFKEVVFVGTGLKGQRKKNYINEVMVRNL